MKKVDHIIDDVVDSVEPVVVNLGEDTTSRMARSPLMKTTLSASPCENLHQDRLCILCVFGALYVCVFQVCIMYKYT